jgi:hypothetical protein
MVISLTKTIKKNNSSKTCRNPDDCESCNFWVMALKAEVADSKNSLFEIFSSESKHCLPIVAQKTKRFSDEKIKFNFNQKDIIVETPTSGRNQP